MNIARFEFSLFGINTYVVYDPTSKKAAIVDPGMINTEEEEALSRFLEKNSLVVTNIIDTHLHIDHAIGVAYAKKKYGVPLVGHREDAFLGERLRQQAEAFGIKEKVEDVAIDTFVEAGDKIKIGNGTLEVLHVPGHSPGSIALYDRRRAVSRFCGAHRSSRWKRKHTHKVHTRQSSSPSRLYGGLSRTRSVINHRTREDGKPVSC